MDSNLNKKADQVSNARNKITAVWRTNESLLYVTENPLPGREINTRYILIGVGTVISLLLFILVLQSCRKAKYNLKSRDKNRRDEECTDTQLHKQGEFCENIALQKIPNKLFLHSDAANYKIEKCTCSKLLSTPIYRQKTNEFANNTLPLKSKYSYIPNRPANHDVSVPTCDLYAPPRPCTSDVCLAKNSRDSYIHPIFVCAFDRPNNTVKSHSYIDIIN